MIINRVQDMKYLSNLKLILDGPAIMVVQLMFCFLVQDINWVMVMVIC